jgi:hypothetical protein
MFYIDYWFCNFVIVGFVYQFVNVVVMADIRLIGIFGLLGDGKTAFATMLARNLANFFNAPIVSNYRFLNTPNTRVLEMSDLVGEEVIDCVVVPDEVYAYADARVSLSDQNRYFSYFISQARKSPHSDGSRGIGNYVIYTSQLQSQVDIRLYDLTNLYVMMERTPSGDFGFEWVRDTGDSGDGIIPYQVMKEQAFDFYSTDQKVAPLGIESMRVNMEKFNPYKINFRVDSICNEMLGKFRWDNPKFVERYTVNDYIRRKCYPCLLSLMVLERLKECVRLGVTHIEVEGVA